MAKSKSRVGRTLESAVESLGDYLKDQRTQARMSLRQLAEVADVSNTYLSQIERGLRKPSADVLQQIAKALRISAEQLYIRAGILSPDEGVGSSVELAVLADPGLSERQKQSLLDVYQSFLALNGETRTGVEEQADVAATQQPVKSVTKQTRKSPKNPNAGSASASKKEK